MGPVSVDANVLYTLTTEGTQDTELGDIFNYNLALTYGVLGMVRHVPAHHHGGHAEFGLDLVLEINGEWRAKDQISGHDNDNSGGNLVYLSPGVRLTTGLGVSLAVLYGHPIVSDFNGDQDDVDYRILSSVAYAF